MSDVNNYRAITTSIALSKLFESQLKFIQALIVKTISLDSRLITSLDFAQQTVDYYVNCGSYVFACFIDFLKGFDRKLLEVVQ